MERTSLWAGKVWSEVARVTSVNIELWQRFSAAEKKRLWWSFHLRQKSSPDPAILSILMQGLGDLLFGDNVSGWYRG